MMNIPESDWFTFSTVRSQPIGTSAFSIDIVIHFIRRDNTRDIVIDANT